MDYKNYKFNHILKQYFVLAEFYKEYLSFFEENKLFFEKHLHSFNSLLGATEKGILIMNHNLPERDCITLIFKAREKSEDDILREQLENMINNL